MRKFALAVIWVLHLFIGFSQTDEKGLINWMSLEEAMQAKEAVPKPIMIDVYTDWCGWCKQMMKTTFSNPNLAKYINQNFYSVRFNAETKDTITYLGKQYLPTSTTKKATHPLAAELFGGSRMSYPTIIFFTEQNQRLVLPGYRKVSELEPFLVYFTDQLYGKADPNIFYEEFQQGFYPDSTAKTKEKGEVKWMSMEEALLAQEKEAKKIFLYINADWVGSSRLMNKSAFQNKVIADYLNEAYYPVYIEAISRDEIRAFGQVFSNRGENPSIHDFVGAVLNGNLQFPATLIFDENQKLINRNQFFLDTKTLEAILVYFRENKHQNTKWEDFIKSFSSTIR